ncbi:protein translocase subunit SecF [Salinibacterium sp. SYSU T00001]|uniref:protein translocase subunit SecF n=1 Tax=Homoserinimonas sedimenticola TaxID=2986805 RepID=UPI0022357339|nr:protein translocase subunit SecF [Salinibacterium sedimenticola]MCW4384323.1 protein translocase subunit SecF [Salinibacterium sedimenticola]
MANFTKFGNDLYTGRRSIDFVGRRRLWYVIAALVIVAAVVGPWLRGGFDFGIEFRGGSQFQVERSSELSQPVGEEAVTSVVDDAVPRVTVIGTDTVRVQTDTVTDDEAFEIRTALADAYGVPLDQVSYSYIGPTWGADITAQSIRALVVFLVLAGVVMALYFRTWKMSVAALAALAHDLILTAGVYGILGFEVTPAAVIGFLTILGYSLYDTVVVFDKVRENTAEDGEASPRTFAESVNLAVNQTLVRSINTSVVAVLPVAAILFIGSFVLGAGTLRDISLALFIGILAGAYSTIFIAAPVYSHLREREPAIAKQTERILEARQVQTASVK